MDEFDRQYRQMMASIVKQMLQQNPHLLARRYVGTNRAQNGVQAEVERTLSCSYGTAHMQK